MGSRAFEKFWQIRRAINLAASRDLKPFGIGLKQAFLIFYLARQGKSSHAQLSRFTNSDPAAISRALNTLLKQGWIAQHDDPRDRRCWELRVTPRGKTLAKKIGVLFRRLEKRFSGSLNARESVSLIQLLDKILAGFRADQEKE